MENIAEKLSMYNFYGSKSDIARQLYEFGETAVFICEADRRFLYRLYVPRGLDSSNADGCTVLIAVHGSLRTFERKIEYFKEFAEYHHCIVVSPLFPGNILNDGNVNGYKFIKEGDIRYDRILLSIVDEVSAKYGVDGSKFLLSGFSGGGQFVNRFLFLHPNRLKGVSIGAPGNVTLLDLNREWWVGVGNLQKEFGISLDLDALRQVPVHLVVGDVDIKTLENTVRKNNPYYMAGANDAGATRIDRLRSLRDSLVEEDINVYYEEAYDAGHDLSPCVRRTKQFFAKILKDSSLFQ